MAQPDPQMHGQPVTAPTTGTVQAGQTYAPGSPPPSAVTPTPGSINGAAPMPIQQFGPTAQVNPTYGIAQTVDPANAQQYLGQYTAMLRQALAPGYAQQMQQFNDSLAARGITNSGAGASLQGDLLGQQAAGTAAQVAPLVSQGFGYAQQDVQANAANAQQMEMANMNAANAATATNAGYYNQDRYTNAGAYNQYLNTLETQGYNTYGNDLNTYLQSFAPSPSVQSIMGQGAAGGQYGYGSIYGSALQAQQAQLAAAAQAAAAAAG